MDSNPAAEISNVSEQQTSDQQIANSDARSRAGQPDQQQQNQSSQSSQQQQQNQKQKPPYTIPGILHYLQYEWHRFEVERQEWEVEKAELSARIALLMGEKKSHENLRHDLIRRIKMLEYCLRMERAKYHKLKHGTDSPPVEGLSNDQQQQEQQIAKEQDENNENASISQQKSAQPEDGLSSNNSSTITYGRELLKHYLQEIGYTDTIIDLRSNRVRSLLGIVDNQSATNQQQISQAQNINSPIDNNIVSAMNSNSIDKLLGENSKKPTKSLVASTNIESSDITASLNRNSPSASCNPQTSSPANVKPTVSMAGKQMNRVGDAESSVLAKFGFLYDKDDGEFVHGNSSNDNDEINDDYEDRDVSDDIVDAADRAASTAAEYSYFDKDRNNTTTIIRQKFDLLDDGKLSSSKQDDTNSTDNHLGRDSIDRMNTMSEQAQTNPSKSMNQSNNWCSQPQKNDAVDIGELASLTTLGNDTNDETPSRKQKQFFNKYRLQSHFDCVRDVKFVDKEHLIVTASEDETLKIWHLNKLFCTSGRRQPNVPITMSTFEQSLSDIEPLHTYRGHTSRVLTITVYGEHIFSGAQDGEIIMWRLIEDPFSADLYAKFDPSILVCRFNEHKDAVWSLEVIENTNSDPLLCSASSDLTIKVWDINSQTKQAIKTIQLESSPTCIIKFPPYNSSKQGVDLAASFYDGKVRLYNIAASLTENQVSSNTQPVRVLESEDSHRINSIVIHPTLPYLASADSNRSIKFWDLKTNRCKSTMVAHLDEVTSLACDPTGKYLLSASHDCSARLWLFEEKACIQEITTHRKKFDEGIFAVAFHPSLSQFATAGADGLAKVFV